MDNLQHVIAEKKKLATRYNLQHPSFDEKNMARDPGPYPFLLTT